MNFFFFLQFHSLETEISSSKKFWKKSVTRAPPITSDFRQKSISHSWITLNMKFCEILCISSRATLAIFFFFTDRHFQQSNCFQDIPKYKFIKNWKSKIFTKPILSSIYTEAKVKRGAKWNKASSTVKLANTIFFTYPSLRTLQPQIISYLSKNLALVSQNIQIALDSGDSNE